MAATDDLYEEEIDYSWHPTEEEFVSPLSADNWVELLADSDFAETDAAKAIGCLRDYGEPATFQQLSIRYRAAMGRYRRWLADAARMAAERFGITEAPSHDQFGMDEWWPLLYQTRATGKPGAGIFEMQLRPEVLEAYKRIAADELKARRAENARQLQRIEQLERARQEERRRAAERTQARPAPAPARQAQPAKKAPAAPAAPAPAPVAAPVEPREAPAPKPTRASSKQKPKAEPKPQVVAAPASAGKTGLPELEAFLRLMRRRAHAPAIQGSVDTDAAQTIDYAARYASRLRYAIALMREAVPQLTCAMLARALGDPSVKALEDVLNGAEVATFAYLDRLRETLFLGTERLEAPDGLEECYPTFVSLGEARGPEGVARMLLDEGTRPAVICYVVDESRSRRTGVIVRFDDVRTALLTREAVSGSAERSSDEALDAFCRMVEELDAYATERGIERTSRQVSTSEWDALARGRMWPGRLLA